MTKPKHQERNARSEATIPTLRLRRQKHDARRREERAQALYALGAVAHDLRTPLAVITGAATTLRDHSARFDAHQRADLLETICEEAERLERLLGNLLDMTRLQSGNLEVKREWVPMEEVIGASLTRLESRLAGRPVRVEVPDHTPLVSADPVLLQQVLVNLLENAAKYTPAASPIEIRASTWSGRLEVEVADRGPGLPEDVESRVFEKFFRGFHPGVGGAGLGLSICLGIARAHGGTLVAANRSGGGAAFRMTLPLGGGAPQVPVDEEGRASEVRQTR